MKASTTASVVLLVTCLTEKISSFSPVKSSTRISRRRQRTEVQSHCQPNDEDGGSTADSLPTRRSALRRGLLSAAAAITCAQVLPTEGASAALGTLPELSDTNALFQSITVDVTDRRQYDDTIAFFTSGFDGMKVLRERKKGEGGVEDTWLGFGPETLSVPSGFVLPVSSLGEYGGHAAIHLRYDPAALAPLYKRSGGEFNEAPAIGDSVAYLQIGVTTYKISKMVETGGNVIDAYGWVNVVAPAGLPVRAIVGVRSDPLMFLAVHCKDLTKSEAFYAKLGFARQEYPYCRPNEGQGQFEPPQPKGSVYLAPSPNSMGVLLLQKNVVATNPVLRSMNIVYAPPEGDDSAASGTADLMDPSKIPVSFVPQADLEKQIRSTTVQGS